MSFEIFTALGNEIDNFVQTGTSSIASGWVSGLSSIIQISITLYICFFGYMVLAGKVRMPIPELIWTLARWGFIFMFISNANGWLDMSADAVNGVKEFLSGDQNVYAAIDARINNYFVLVTTICEQLQATGTFDVGAKIWEVFNLCLTLPMLVGILTNAVIILISDITLKVLIAVLPLFLFCLMWGWLRDMFAQWLQAVIGNCLIILFVNVFSQMGIEIANQAIQMNDVSWDIHKPLGLLIAGGLTISACKFGRDLAIQLARVSVERTATSEAFKGAIASHTIHPAQQIIRAISK